MSAEPKTVLMIEDNPADAAVIREELESTGQQGLAIATENTLAGGLDYLTSHKIDGVLLDLSLPDSHGIETFQRARKEAPELPIVVLTGNDNEELGLQAVREGAQDYIVKGKLNGAGLARAIDYAVERKLVESKLRRAQKMEAISHMAMSIAGDFNNVLMVILMKLQELQWPLRGDEHLSTRLHEATDAVFRGANLSKKLINFAQPQPVRTESIDVSDKIRDLSSYFAAVVGRGCEYITKFAADTWPVQINPDDLETSLVNLLANAREAMVASGGGSVTVSTSNVRVEQDEFQENTAGPGDYVLISVADIGIGMQEKELEFAIEPFYSTKADPIGKGYGLGLSVVFGFARQSGGFMRIETAEGAGTDVQLYLPRDAAKASDARPTAPSRDTGLGAREKIIVLEPEQHVRNALVEQLGELGYTAIGCESPARAMDQLERHDDVQAVIVDVLQTDSIDGPSVGKELIDLKPGVKVLYTSAHSRSAFKHIGIDDEIEDVLFKPYRRSDLAQKLRELLTD